MSDFDSEGAEGEPGATMTEWKEVKDLFDAYEQGKHRRYTLLFAVNGGAFAVVGLLLEHGLPREGPLTVQGIALGMIAFTGILCFDIYAFGRNMRKQWLTIRTESHCEGLFGLPGKAVLTALGFLIILGWVAAFVAAPNTPPTGCCPPRFRLVESYPPQMPRSSRRGATHLGKPCFQKLTAEIAPRWHRGHRSQTVS